ncbi:MAG: SufBD protein [Bacteroidetes bacterium]|nr:MAG: SufBD protein [Bacteroidota bacterium]
MKALDPVIDLSAFAEIETVKDAYASPEKLELSDEDKASLRAVGVNMEDRSGTGKFLMHGTKIYTIAPWIPGVEIIPMKEALLRYPDIRERYYFKAVDPQQDEFSRTVFEKEPNGYFIRVKKNVSLDYPLHTGLFMHKEMSTMCIHNIVVLEEGASLHLITGCTAGCSIRGGLHIALSEQYVGKGAKLVSTMIHNWGSEFVVRPRSGTIVEDDATYVSNYYAVKPAKNIQSNPFTHIKGKRSSAKYMSVLASFPDTYSDFGGTVLIEGEDSGAELVARAVNHGGTVIQTGLLIGAAKGARAHVDCSGLMLSDRGKIEAVPGLRALHPEARMSHEAAIGRIDRGEVNYLMSKGLEEMQAIALIVRGFLDIGIEMEGLEPELEETIAYISALSGHGED